MDPIIDYKAARPASVALSQFMSRVYGWMTFGLLITAVISYVIGSDPALAMSVAPYRMLIGLATVGLALGISFGINRLSVGAATGLFILYSFLIGVFLSSIFLIYTQTSIAQTFITTAGAFAGLALYGAVTKRDLTAIGTFCGMALWGLILVPILNYFLFKSVGLQMVTAFAGILIFSGLTAYDTQKVKQFGMSGQTETDEGHKFAILGALALYLDFINLFLYLLQFMGGGRRRDY